MRRLPVLVAGLGLGLVTAGSVILPDGGEPAQAQTVGGFDLSRPEAVATASK